MFSKQGELDLARVLKALIDAGDIEPRPGFRGAGLVDHGPAGVRQGYANPKGNPLFGTEITGAIHKGKILPKNQEKLNKLMEIITESNNNYTKSITSNLSLIHI